MDRRREASLKLKSRGALDHQITGPIHDPFWRGRGEKSVDFGTQDWYTKRPRANNKCLILLSFWKRRGNPSLSATIKWLRESPVK
ncbi:hypothetical protein SAMN05443247_01241 [Bradyrhizobium erythrophlei]|nr:hypothetical protein SAMN05443247_01241 [Bradyrhizobium erythrophlei]